MPSLDEGDCPLKQKSGPNEDRSIKGLATPCWRVSNMLTFYYLKLRTADYRVNTPRTKSESRNPKPEIDQSLGCYGEDGSATTILGSTKKDRQPRQ